tara:strand:+ start:100 stop:540 length:441 start_codon:yes stop_codon:yes gene_type:complete
MKSYTQFIKEVNTSVYGEVTVGSKPSTITKKSISSGIDKAIKNIGSGKGESTVAKKGGYGLSGGVNISMRGGSSQSPTKTKTKTKVKPAKTTDPIKSTPSNDKEPNRPNLVSSSSSPSTQSSSTQSPSRITNPKTQRISDIRMGRM